MAAHQNPEEALEQIVALLGDALGISRWDEASLKGLRAVVNSDFAKLYMRPVTIYYVKKNDPFDNPFPSMMSIMREALVYHSPTLGPDSNYSIDTTSLEWGLDEIKKKRRRLQGEFHIALFAARIVHHVESGNSAFPLVSEEMAWFPVKYHHKISFAVALMWLLYLGVYPLARYSLAQVKTAACDALVYLSSSHRCTACGQDYADSKVPLCSVCPTLEEGEILEFERLRELNVLKENQLKSDVDEFFDSFWNDLFPEDCVLNYDIGG